MPGSYSLVYLAIIKVSKIDSFPLGTLFDDINIFSRGNMQSIKEELVMLYMATTL